MISKDEFNQRVICKLHNIAELFQNKNDQYGDVDPLQNFSRGALIRYRELSMETRFETLKDYVLKHISHVYNNNLYGEKVDQSIDDIAVYFLIASVMHDLKDEEPKQTLREIKDVEELEQLIDQDVFIIFPNKNGAFYRVAKNIEGKTALVQANISLTLDYLDSMHARVFELKI